MTKAPPNKKRQASIPGQDERQPPGMDYPDEDRTVTKPPEKSIWKMISTPFNSSWPRKPDRGL
jgi:hypothetical protein